MISRSSFFKLIKEDLRQRLWTIILAAIVFILPVPIYIAMEITNFSGFSDVATINFSRRLANAMASDSGWMILVTVVGATICAVNGFGYLFSKKKVDFFHSLPVKREVLFVVRYINGVLIYLVPYLAMILVSLVIMAVSGNLTGAAFLIIVKGLAVHLMGYLTLYTTLILCVTFVGNIVVFFAVSGWTFGITAISVVVYSWFEEQFFDTFRYLGDVTTQRLHSLRFLCPGYFYVRAAGNYGGKASILLQQLAFTVVLGLITLLVYRMRPSDGAGKAISFPVLKPVIRISVELLAGLLMGMMFFNMAGSSEGVPGWMIFGVILGVVLSHMLVQSIFYFDVRKCFAGKLSMGACALVAGLFALVMRYDLFGYDTYLPKKRSLEAVAVEMPRLDGHRSSYYYDGTKICWIDEVDEMKLTDVSGVYPYLEALVADTERYTDWNRGDASSRNNFIRVNVAYHLKNGKKVYREYWVDGMREELFAPVFNSPEYKKVHYGDIYTIPTTYIQSVIAKCAMNTQVMALNEAEKEELMSILRREISAQTLNEKLHTKPVAVLNVRIVERRARQNAYGSSYESYKDVYDYDNEMPIYSSFTETLRFLKDRGFQPVTDYEWTGMEKMRVNLPEVESKKPVGEISSFEGVEVTEYVLEDEIKFATQTIAYPEEWEYGYNTIPVEPEDFERLYELCIWEPLCNYGNPTDSIYDDYRVFLEVPRDGYNIYETYNFVIPKDADLTFLFD